MKIYIKNFLKTKNISNNKKENKIKENNLVEEHTSINQGNSNIINSDNVKELSESNIDIKHKDRNNYNDENHYIRKGAYCNNHKIISLNNDKKKINISTKKVETNNKEKKSDQKLRFNKYNLHNLPKSYYVLLFFMISLAGISIYMVKKSNNYSIEEDYAVFSSLDNSLNIDENNSSGEENYNLQNTNTSNEDTRDNFENTASSVNSNVIAQVQEKVNNIVEKKEEPLVFSKPLDGEISKIFSNDKVIYSKTLEMWKTHDGIDVKGNIGDIVYSIERGTVEKIYDDAFYGVTIVINHGQGYKSSYSNLSEDTFINVGDKVKKSQKIGKLGITSIGEIKDEPHLHFMLYENNVISDPSSIFK